MSQSAKADASYEPVQGPWCALLPSDIMSLAEGTLEEREVRWKNETLTMTRQHGVRGLSHVPQHMIRPAHALLLLAFEDEQPDVKIAARVLPGSPSAVPTNCLTGCPSCSTMRTHGCKRRRVQRWRRSPFPSGVRSSLENELRSPSKEQSGRLERARSPHQNLAGRGG